MQGMGELIAELAGCFLASELGLPTADRWYVNLARNLSSLGRAQIGVSGRGLTSCARSCRRLYRSRQSGERDRRRETA